MDSVHSVRTTTHAMLKPALMLAALVLLAACGSSDDRNGLARIEIVPSAAEIGVGETLQLGLNGYLDDGQAVDISPGSVSWLSSVEDIATIDSGGLVTAAEEGETTITAAVSGFTDQMRLQVRPSLRMQILPPLLTEPVGTRTMLIALGFQSDFETIDLTEAAAWISSDESIATVSSSGEVLVVARGTASISARFEEAYDVIPAIAVQTELVEIEVSPAVRIVTAGIEVQYAATGLFADGTVTDLTDEVDWSSINSAVASVDSDGLASALAPGSTQIRAALGWLLNS